MVVRTLGIAALAVGFAGVAGCALGAAEGVTRVVDGHVLAGPYVAPATYEAFVRAELSLAAGRLDEAEEGYRETLREVPGDPLVSSRLAELLAKRGRAEEADALVDDVLRAHPESEAAWLARARLAGEGGDLDGALDAYARAGALAPGSLAAALELARLLAAHGSSARAEARLLDEAEARGPDGARAAQQSLALALARGDGEHAERATRLLLQLAPGRRPEVLDAARASLDGGRPALAARILDGVPEARDDVSLRARAYLAAGRAEDARASLARAEGADPTLATTRARFALDAETLPLLDEALAAPGTGSRVEAAWLAGREALAAGRDEEAALLWAAIPAGTRFHEAARGDLAELLGGAGLGDLARELGAATEGEGHPGGGAARAEAAAQ